MSWTISGNRRDLTYIVASNGCRVFRGGGSQKPPMLSYLFGSTLQQRVLNRLIPWEQRLKSCGCQWELRLSPSPLFQYEEAVSSYADPLRSMIEKVKNAPDRPQWRVIYNSNTLSFVLILSSHPFDQVHRQFELLLANDSLGYCMNFEYNGFNVDPVPLGEPTFEQFFSGAPLLLDSPVRIAIYARTE